MTIFLIITFEYKSVCQMAIFI